MIRILSLAVATLLAWAPAAHAEEVAFTFDRGVEGLPAAGLYAGSGVRLSPSAHLVATPLARSGRQALGAWRPGDEFPDGTLTVDLERALGVSAVRLHAGVHEAYGPSDGHVAVTARAYSVSAALVARATATIETDASGAAPVATELRLEADPGAGPIGHVVVENDSGVPVLIDDLVLDAASPRRPRRTKPPSVVFHRPRAHTVLGLYTPPGSRWPRPETLRFDVRARAPETLAAIHVAERGRRFFACGGDQPPCTAVTRWTRDYTSAGDHRVTATPIGLDGRRGRPVRRTISVRAVRETVAVTGAPDARAPLVRDFAVRVRLPAERRLQRVWLRFPDEGQGVDPTLDLPATTARGRGLHRIHVMRAELPVWDVGANVLIVHARTTGPDGPVVHTVRRRFPWRPPTPSWGIAAGGARFEVPGVPPFARDCPLAVCKDADRDGLVDLWESVAVDRLRPSLVLDEREEMLRRDGHTIRTVVRVTPVSADGEEAILFRYAIAHTRDYGAPGPAWGDHDGDVFDPADAVAGRRRRDPAGLRAREPAHLPRLRHKGLAAASRPPALRPRRRAAAVGRAEQARPVVGRPRVRERRSVRLPRRADAAPGGAERGRAGATSRGRARRPPAR